MSTYAVNPEQATAILQKPEHDIIDILRFAQMGCDNLSNTETTPETLQWIRDYRENLECLERLLMFRDRENRQPINKLLNSVEL